VGEEEISEGALLAPLELLLVFRVHLQTQIHAQNERGDAGNKTGKESVEGESSHQATVNELNNTGEETVGQVSIDEFELERGRFLVVGGKFGNDSSEFSRASAHSVRQSKSDSKMG